MGTGSDMLRAVAQCGRASSRLRIATLPASGSSKQFQSAVLSAPRSAGHSASHRAFATGGRAGVVAKWKAQFREADSDGSGFLEKDEVRRVLEREAAEDDQPSAEEVARCMA